MFIFKKKTGRANGNLMYDKNEFVIQDVVLRRYKGESKSIVVPRGIKVISNIDLPICDHTIQAIFIPRTVQLIAESALEFCQNVYYEGSKQEWERIEIDTNNFNSWIPQEHINKPNKEIYRVYTEFKFDWNSCIWDMQRH